MSFADTLAEHLAAIEARDLGRLTATVSRHAVLLVTSRGETSTAPVRFLALHEEWFRSTTWTIDTRLLESRVDADVALVLLALDYRDRRPDGSAIHERSVLGLGFAREDGAWVLVYDQNTPCAAPAAA